MQKNYKSIQVFKSPFLEKFSHVHPLTPLIVWLPVFCWLMWRSFAVLKISPYMIGMLGFMGFSSWTLAEYLLHRFLFHFEVDTPRGHRFHFLIHGLHHEDPMDPTRLVMPPPISMVLGTILYTVFSFILGSEWVQPFFAFFLLGYLCYDYIHFYVHHFTPKSALGRLLKSSHMQHHFTSPNSRWGVSSPFWDYIFGTLEDLKDKEKVV